MSLGGHARDADTIAGDNAQIFRIVGTNGAQSTPNAYLTFNYDNYAGVAADRPARDPAARLHAGRPGASTPAQAATDRGLADEIHGESGDDTSTAAGNDVLFGDAQDDDLIGGWGNDWISGGTGQDGVLGDDGRIFTSRNSRSAGRGGCHCSGNAAGTAQRAALRHPALLATDPDTRDSERQRPQRVHLHARPGPDGDDQRRRRAEEGGRHHAVQRRARSATRPLFDANNSDDIIFGGLGDDFLHGGSGDDAISGAEALSTAYVQLYAGTCQQARLDACVIGLVPHRLDAAVQPGRHAALRRRHEPAGTRTATRRAPRRVRALRRVRPAPRDPVQRRRQRCGGCAASRTSGHTCTDTGGPAPTGRPVLPQLDASNEGAGHQRLRARRRPNGTCTRVRRRAAATATTSIFGDLGNDWLVGGTGKDTLWGGWGNDLLNADDDLSTAATTQRRQCTRRHR